MLILSKLASGFFPVTTDALPVDAMQRVVRREKATNGISSHLH
jgi:hypothetical protein